MTNHSVASLVTRATESAQEAGGFSVSADRAEAKAAAAQAEATAALALAVKHAGEAIGLGLKSIADAIARS